MKTQYDVIIRPIISEKSTALAEVGNRYAFEVARASTKGEIRDAIQNLFAVKVREVRTMIMHGKVKRSQRGGAKKPNWKKAIVTIGEGQKIEFFQAK